MLMPLHCIVLPIMQTPNVLLTLFVFLVCCAEADTRQHIKAAIIKDFFIVLKFNCSLCSFVPQKYSKKSLFFQVQRPLQTFAKPILCFTTRCSSRLQHFIYRSPTCPSRRATLSTAAFAHRRPPPSPFSGCRQAPFHFG